MNKCKFCEHCAKTNRGELVCDKYLVYVGKNVDLIGCREFLISPATIFIAGAIALSVIVLLIVAAQNLL